MESFEDETTELCYSTILEAELFSFYQLTENQKFKIRQLLDLGEIIDVDSEIALKAAELRALSSKQHNRKLKLPDALIAATGDDTQSFEMRYEDENIWLTQKMLATLYGVEVPTINEHIKKIFSDRELQEESTIRNFRIVQTEGSRFDIFR